MQLQFYSLASSYLTRRMIFCKFDIYRNCFDKVRQTNPGPKQFSIPYLHISTAWLPDLVQCKTYINGFIFLSVLY